MKKILYLLLFLNLPFVSKPQAPVIDPAQISASFISFLQSLDQAIATTERIAKGVQQGDSMINRLQKIKDVYDKINPLIQNIQAIKDVSENMYRAVEFSKNSYDIMRKSKHFTHYEVIWTMDLYTSLLNSLSNGVTTITSYLQADKWKMNDKERIDAVNEETGKQEALLDFAEQEYMDIYLTEQTRRKIDDLWKSGQLNNPMAYLHSHTYTRLQSMPAELEVERIISTVFGDSQDEDLKNYHPDKMDPAKERIHSQYEQQNRTFYENEFVLGKTVFYGVVIFMALFGLIKVYRKITSGEDVVETIVNWVFAVLLTYSFGELLHFFFFGK